MLWLWLGHELGGLRVLLLLTHRLGEQGALRLPHLRLLLGVRLRQVRVPRLLEVSLAIGVGGLLWGNLADWLGEH